MNKQIFRAIAAKNYLEGREKEVLPRIVRPRFFLYLWIITGLLVLLLGLAWSVRIPLYLGGVGMLASEDQMGQNATLFGFLPANALNKLQPGQKVQVREANGNLLTEQKIETVEAAVLSPAAVRERYPQLAGAITQPVAVITLKGGPELQAAGYSGGLVMVEAAVGSHSILKFLPVLDKLIGE